MAAVVKTESSFKPFSIGINKSAARLSRQPQTKDEAVSTARWLISSGYNIDLGFSQINSANLKRLRMSVDDAFDPCANLAGGAAILTENYKAALLTKRDPQTALLAAISTYNTGNQIGGFRNGYVRKVTANASRHSARPVESSPAAAIPLVPKKPLPNNSLVPRGEHARPRHIDDQAAIGAYRAHSEFVYGATGNGRPASPFVY